MRNFAGKKTIWSRRASIGGAIERRIPARRSRSRRTILLRFLARGVSSKAVQWMVFIFRARKSISRYSPRFSGVVK